MTANRVQPRLDDGGDSRKAANGDWYLHEMLDIPFVLKSGVVARVLLPPDGLSQADAVRLAAMVVEWAVPLEDGDG